MDMRTESRARFFELFAAIVLGLFVFVSQLHILTHLREIQDEIKESKFDLTFTQQRHRPVLNPGKTYKIDTDPCEYCASAGNGFVMPSDTGKLSHNFCAGKFIPRQFFFSRLKSNDPDSPRSPPVV